MWSSDGGHPFEKPIDRFRRLTHELSWSGTYWGAGGAIYFAKRLFREREKIGERRQALSAISSTYYSAAGNATARVQKAKFFGKLLWFFRCFLCFYKAMKFSDELEAKVGIGGMNHDELDIRSSILRKAGRCEEALVCSKEALSREGISSDSRVLLEIGLGEIMDEMENKAEADGAYFRANGLIGDIKPTTSVRYYRSRAGHHKYWGEPERAKDMLRHALGIAKSYGLADQITKIEPLLAKLS